MYHTPLMAPPPAPVSYKINVHTGVFDWSKGTVKKNSASKTFNNVPSLPVETLMESSAAKAEVRQAYLTDDELEKKVLLFTNLTHACRGRIPEMLAREATLLGPTDFSRLMNALESHGDEWSCDERYYVFKYANGIIGSVWLAGVEVYSSLCPEVYMATY